MSDPCKERITLVLNYSDATKRYCEAVAEIHEKIGDLSKDNYQSLYRLAEEARVAAETARLLVETHISEHEC